MWLCYIPALMMLTYEGQRHPPGLGPHSAPQGAQGGEDVCFGIVKHRVGSITNPRSSRRVLIGFYYVATHHGWTRGGLPTTLLLPLLLLLLPVIRPGPTPRRHCRPLLLLLLPLLMRVLGAAATSSTSIP